MAIEKVELKDALNALVTNTNIDKVTGVLGGVPSNISKADLSSAVAGVMDTNNLFPFMYKGQISDLNNVIESGYYITGFNSANSPSYYCSVMVIKTGVYITQYAKELTSKGRLYVRTGNGDAKTWAEWDRIDNFGYNTLDDLSSAVVGQMDGSTKLSLQGSALNYPAEIGYWRKIAEFTAGISGRIVAIFTSARLESQPHAHIAILDLNVYRSTVYAKLHTLVDGTVLKLYYKKTDDKTVLYAASDTSYGRISVSILMQYGVTVSIGGSELIDESATIIQ